MQTVSPPTANDQPAQQKPDWFPDGPGSRGATPFVAPLPGSKTRIAGDLGQALLDGGSRVVVYQPRQHADRAGHLQNFVNITDPSPSAASNQPYVIVPLESAVP